MRALLVATLILALTPSWATPTVPSTKSSRKVTKAVAPVPVQEPLPLDDAQLSVVPNVLLGESQCEFGRKVRLEPHPQWNGRFLLTLDQKVYTLTPQPTTTGVIRLENTQDGLLWLQVPVKSMLMNSKIGQRMADNCLHSAQVAEVEAMRVQEEATSTTQTLSQ
ncbi:hypothetical protein [Inhella gelatinilytica]|uniref:Uncharacterized protein n=1 Tax=Inhella gelatinilytica TaxID=2795030 RepID=A0A931NAW3_9BURK|nr:hypothetical protein [Inhella gelatinilytica]MBH9552918.1 hypothetical protein [Inhella gelatinilytica]